MRQLMFRSLTLCFSIFLISQSSNALFAQGPSGLGYRAYWPVIPVESTGNLTVWDFAFEENGTDPVALVAGSYERIDRPGDTGFVYDHSGLIDPTQKQKFWDLMELVGGSLPSWVPTGFDRTRIYGVNSSGRICGSIWDSSGTNNQNVIGFYIDLTDPNREMKQLPAFYTTAAKSWGWKVNEIGDILLVGTSSDSYSEIEVSVYNPELDYLVHVRKNQNEPFFFNGYDRLGFNSNLNILGELPGDAFYEPCLKHRALEETSDVNGIGLSFIDSGETTNFQDYFAPTGINEYSQFGCRSRVQRRGKKWDYYNTRIAADGSIEWQNRTDFPGWVDDINNSGDLFWGQQNETPSNAYYLHEGDPNVVGDETFIEEFFQLVIPESDPNGVFQSNGPSDCKLSDRDPTTGFGWIAGRQLSPDGSGSWALFLLIPEVPAPDPGVSVSPTSGLVTTEFEEADTFDVVLTSEPSADVNIGISSSNTDEGTVDQASLTFTPANWDTPQTVNVTGVDDVFVDGDVSYTILTAAATSSDPDYDGLNADDVLVTNEDNDSPPGGDSETYDSADTPLAIPDNDADGIASDILAGDHLITNLTVNIDITHQRPSDLEVYLVGPDGGPPVQLFNFSGDNVVADFNGDSSLGLWTLEVYDTRKKKTGTLNSWSITVDY